MSNDRAAVMRLLRTWELDAALRAECDILSAQGVWNFIEYSDPRVVRLAAGRIKIVDSSREYV